MKKPIWITWETQRRNKEIADVIPAEYIEMSDTLKKHRLIRYTLNTWKTLKLYITKRPNTVICQNPSVVLASITVLAGKVFGFKVGIDAHNGALALDGNPKWQIKIAEWLQRNADFTIITNQALKEHVEANGGHAIVLPDKVPTIKKKGTLSLDHNRNVLFISSFAQDEPYKEVIEAASKIDSNIGVYVTGRHHGRINETTLPENVHLTGYISWDDFDKMMYSVDAIIDLTTRENCLLCGAYESVAVKKPLILSGTKALKEYFSMGTLYTDNTASDIANCISLIVENKFNKKLSKEMSQLEQQLANKWSNSIQEVRDNIS